MTKLQKIEKNSNIHLFYGGEDFLIEEEVNLIKNNAIKLFKNEISIQKIDGENASEEEIIGFIVQPSLFSSNRLLIISNYSFDESEALASALKNIGDDLIIVFTAEKIDNRKKIIKFLREYGKIKEFKPFSEWEQDKSILWIIQRAELSDKSIDKETANLLNEISGPSLRQLDKEIKKLALYCSDKPNINKEDLLALSTSGQMNSFAFANSIFARDLRKAISALNYLFIAKERPEAIIGTLASRIRLLLEAKCFQDRNEGIELAAKELGRSPYFLKQCFNASSLFKKEELLNHLKNLHEADINIKTTQTSPQVLIELLLVDML